MPHRAFALKKIKLLRLGAAAGRHRDGHTPRACASAFGMVRGVVNTLDGLSLRRLVVAVEFLDALVILIFNLRQSLGIARLASTIWT
jgi:hypothetical protein